MKPACGRLEDRRRERLLASPERCYCADLAAGGRDLGFPQGGEEQVKKEKDDKGETRDRVGTSCLV